jgi:hypothetical protein
MDPTKIVVSFANAKIRLYDIETGKVIMTLKGSDDSFGKIKVMEKKRNSLTKKKKNT